MDVYTMYVFRAMVFEWDEEKYFSNLLKHWVRFEYASELWSDPAGIEFLDSENSNDEERLIRIGHSPSAGILLVVFCERKGGLSIRIISARRVTKLERSRYERRI